MAETFNVYRGGDPRVTQGVLDLEYFIGELDGKDIDGGTIDADDAVKAFNVLIAALEAKDAEVKRLTAEIDRLKDVNRRALAIADERAIEAVKARASRRQA